MDISTYFSNVAVSIQHQSNALHDSFKSHKLTIGENREELVAKFFENHLPLSFGVGAGLITSRNGIVSNQADVIVFDQLLNKPLHAEHQSALYLIESVYSLVESKTSLTPTALDDSFEKCKRFKNMTRNYLGGPHQPRITNSLFVVFAFSASQPETFYESFRERVEGVNMNERPDLIVVPNSFVLHSGQYFELARIGQPNSPHRLEIEKQGSGAIQRLLAKGFEMAVLGEYSLMGFFMWFVSWLVSAGPRTTDLISYLPPDRTWGRRLQK